MFYLTQTEPGRCGDIGLRHLLMLVFRNSDLLLIEQSTGPYTSMKELIDRAKACGISLCGYRLHDESYLRSVKKPVIVLTELFGEKHYIVVVKYIYGRYVVLDGAGPPKTIKGKHPSLQPPLHVLVIEHVNRSIVKKQKCLVYRDSLKIVNYLIHILSLFSFIGGLYFINVSSLFEWPLLLFTLGALLLVVEQMIISKRLRSFDNKIQSRLPNIASISDLNDIYTLKGVVIKGILPLINGVIVISLATSLLLIDNLLQGFIVLFVLMLSFLYYLIEKAITDRKMMKLMSLEKQIISCNDKKRDYFDNLNRTAYQVAHIKILLRATYIFVIGVASLLISALLGNVYLNYFLFEFGILYFIGSQLLTLLEFNTNKRQYYQLMYRFFIA